MLGDATTEFANRVLAGILGTYDTWAIYVGDKLGLYRVMRERPSLTHGELAAATGVDARYVREWIEQQAVTGFVTYDDPAAPAEERRYTLPPAAAEVLTDTESLAFLAPFVRLVTAAGIQLPALLDAYRHGGGVGWREFGEDMRTGQAEMNRPWFLHAMTTDWFPHVPEIHDRLTGGARVADIGCGEGWSSIGLALGYPRATVWLRPRRSLHRGRRRSRRRPRAHRPGDVHRRRRRSNRRERQLRPGLRLRVHPRPRPTGGGPRCHAAHRQAGRLRDGDGRAGGRMSSRAPQAATWSG